MAFSKKTWLDRIAEYPTRRRLKKSDGTDEIVTVSREEGAISQEGDAFSAENMNDLEERVANEFDSLNLKLDGMGFSSIAFSKEIIYVEANKQKRTPITINGKLVGGVIMSVSAYGGNDNFLCKSSFLKASETNANIDLTCNIAGNYQVQYMMFLK